LAKFSITVKLVLAKAAPVATFKFSFPVCDDMPSAMLCPGLKPWVIHLLIEPVTVVALTVEITIDDPQDVIDLVRDKHFFAFYPAVARQDGSVGRLVIDLDVQAGVVQQLGQPGAWALACCISDELVIAARSVG
jgi:hypothetical protein